MYRYHDRYTVGCVLDVGPRTSLVGARKLGRRECDPTATRPTAITAALSIVHRVRGWLKVSPYL